MAFGVVAQVQDSAGRGSGGRNPHHMTGLGKVLDLTSILLWLLGFILIFPFKNLCIQFRTC